MTRGGDAASCAALAAELHASAHALLSTRESRDGARAGDIREVAEVMADLAEELAEFAHAIRSGEGPRAGRPHPHTALKSACARALRTLDAAPERPDLDAS